MTEPNSISDTDGRRRPNWLGIGVGAAVMAIVAIMFLSARAYNTLPAGFPWSGVIWMAIGYAITRPALRGKSMPKWIYWSVLALAIVGGAIWAAVTFGVIVI